ncbi:MAG: hypothetical protein HY403_09645, partial [Elusimicrobia bacterium]|nr:hypothetical protein [Elusimicrobiota bacterium]
EAGVAAENIKFLSAVHEGDGDEWRFFFGWGSESGGLLYAVSTRRGLSGEPELRGPISAEHLASGIAAPLFDSSVRVIPDAALKDAAGATRASLLPRVESGAKELWYSLQDSGRELASVNARTGETRRAPPAPASSSALRDFLQWLGLAGLVAAIYGAMFWAGAHAPAAVPQGLPDGLGVPVPSFQDLFLGLGALGAAPMPSVTDDDVRASVAAAILQKGRPWSETEYHSAYYQARESLKSRGATQEQLALYDRLCAAAPVKGGGFNPWSGD